MQQQRSLRAACSFRRDDALPAAAALLHDCGVPAGAWQPADRAAPLLPCPALRSMPAEELSRHFDPQHIDDSLGGAIPVGQVGVGWCLGAPLLAGAAQQQGLGLGVLR